MDKKDKKDPLLKQKQFNDASALIFAEKAPNASVTKVYSHKPYSATPAAQHSFRRPIMRILRVDYKAKQDEDARAEGRDPDKFPFKISHEAKVYCDAALHDAIDRIGSEIIDLKRKEGDKRATTTPHDVQHAIKLVFPQSMWSSMIEKGEQALEEWNAAEAKTTRRVRRKTAANTESHL
ncbi:hypothetical protein BC940DRAFT_356380 [Gongronella butleri]|nr:hypothetical protein BC940DRAFT_356380 [Gongronella butleri]